MQTTKNNKTPIKLIKYLTSLIAMLMCFNLFANTPACYIDYCQYNGKVKSIYVNGSNLILIYFENPMDIDAANTAGLNITRGDAAAILIDSAPEFSKLAFATALSAQAQDKSISLQLRGSYSGYPAFDRIWLPK